MENYLCVDYLCLQKAQIPLERNGFVNTTFNNISGIGITELLMKIMSCNWFMKDNETTIISSCSRILVFHYL